MARTNPDYWAMRMRLLEESLLKRSYEYVENMERQFALAQVEVEKELALWWNRFAANNKITLANAKRLLTSGELAEFRWTVGEYIAYGQQNALDGARMKQMENVQRQGARFAVGGHQAPNPAAGRGAIRQSDGPCGRRRP